MAAAQRQQHGAVLRLLTLQRRDAGLPVDLRQLGLGVGPAAGFQPGMGAAQAQLGGIDIQVARLAVDQGLGTQQMRVVVAPVQQRQGQQVEVGARGVVVQPVVQRQRQAALQLLPAGRIINRAQRGAGCAVQGKGQRLGVAQRLGQRQAALRPLPGLRAVRAQQMQLGHGGVGHRQLAVGAGAGASALQRGHCRQGVWHGGALAVQQALQPGQPAQVDGLATAVARGAALGQCLQAGGHRLMDLVGDQALVGTRLQQRRAFVSAQPLALLQGQSVQRRRLVMRRRQRRAARRLRRQHPQGLGEPGALGMVHAPGRRPVRLRQGAVHRRMQGPGRIA